ncbi:DUF1302 domain-containing protein [Pseudomonas nicosulfuronedens]|uniref:DUF1302 domain-containing protein n=2 Tax=Pseudomonas nicosulfuronedens TaxID=2571105 RepID=A0A5R9QMT2_9PSED|nr:DUF1302 family protein [Pseudomonas nitritireducens]TLX70619.1 DUF1302 domain-containing protein [Pseudomonas nicosulfuronedens]
MMPRFTQPRFASSKRLHAQASLLAMAVAAAAGNAYAVDLDFGNSDIQSRLDTTVRYNIGIRGENTDSRLKMGPAGTPDPNNNAVALGNNRFDKGDVILNRLDILSEFDFIFRDNYGFRMSAAAWYDPTYDGGVDDPSYGDAISREFFKNGKYSDYTRNYTTGPYAELLDGFVFGTFDVGTTTTSLKFGRHNIYWGNSLFPQSKQASIAYSQAALDLQKAAYSPGLEAKELFLPQTQFTGTLQLNPEFSLAWQYSLEWRRDRYPEGGTFFEYAGPAFYGADGPIIGETKNKPGSGQHDWGVMAKWQPDFMDGGNMSLVFREFREKTPNPFATADDGLLDRVYNPKKNQLFGFAMEQNIASVNWGLELTYRKNAQLYTTVTGRLQQVGPAIVGFDSQNAPRGDVYGIVLNAVKLLPETPLWDAGEIAAELAFQHLDKVTYDPAFGYSINGDFTALGGNNFPMKGSSSPLCSDGSHQPGSGDESYGCATRNSTVFSTNFTPRWLQVLPGVDLSAPVFVSWGVQGNAATGGLIGAEDQVSYSFGVQADIYQTHTVKLAWNDSWSPNHNTYTSTGAQGVTGGGTWWQNDHGWLSLSLKTAF